jgi:hypothetical protein
MPFRKPFISIDLAVAAEIWREPARHHRVNFVVRPKNARSCFAEPICDLDKAVRAPGTGAAAKHWPTGAK